MKIVIKYSLFGSVTRRKPILSENNMAAWLMLGKLDWNKLQGFWNYVLWTEETKVELFSQTAQHHIRQTQITV